MCGEERERLKYTGIGGGESKKVGKYEGTTLLVKK